MIDTLASSLPHLLFVMLVVVSVCVGALFTITGAVLLTVLPTNPVTAFRELKLAISLFAFGLSGFAWGAITLPQVLL